MSRTCRVVIMLVFALLAVSCRRRISTGQSAAGEEFDGGAGISVLAELMPGREEIEDQFKRFMPDSGIVPVRIVVTNKDVRTLRIHSANTLPLGKNFTGFSLAAAGDTFHPMHPLDVFKVLMGRNKNVTYKKRSIFKMLSGSILMPPLTGYYAYGELKEGRYYRPLFGKSFLPALESGMHRAVELQTREEAEGYLYFAVPRDLNPYTETGAGTVGGRQPLELVTRACFSNYPRDTLPVFDCAFTRVDGMPSLPVKKGAAQGTCAECAVLGLHKMLIALRRSPGSKRSAELVVGSARDLPEHFDDSFTKIDAVRSTKTVIADVSALDGRCACALNFKSKSRIYLIDMSSKPVLIRKKSLSRGVKRVFTVKDGVLVVTTDGFCHLLAGDELSRKRYIRLGNDVMDVALHNGVLVVVDADTVDLYGTTGDVLFKSLGSHPLPGGRRRFIGVASPDGLYMLNLSGGAAGDTLVYLDRSHMSENGRFPLPGRVAAGAVGRSLVYLQLEDGTILVLERRVAAAAGASGSDEPAFDIVEAAYLPFTIRALYTEGNRFTAVGVDGTVARGSLSDYYPGVLDVLETSVEVEWGVRD
jgi:hypothetical protein